MSFRTFACPAYQCVLPNPSIRNPMNLLLPLPLTVTAILSMAALAQAEVSAPVSPSPWQMAPQRVRARQSWLAGDFDEGDRLFNEALSNRPTQGGDADIVKVHERSHVARAALENDLPVRAMLLAERALAGADTYLGKKTHAPGTVRAGVFAAKSYVYHRVLHDHEMAAALLREALKLDPGNAAYLATLDQLRLHTDGLRVFGTATPQINASYAAARQAPSLQTTPKPGTGFLLSLQVPEAGSYRVECSTDLISWVPLWQGQLATGPTQINDDQSGEAIRFYRLVTLNGEPR